MLVETLRRADRSLTNFFAEAIASGNEAGISIAKVLHERVQAREKEMEARGMVSTVDLADYSVESFITHTSKRPDIQAAASQYASGTELIVAAGLIIGGMVSGRGLRRVALGLAGAVIGGAVLIKEHNKLAQANPH